MIDEQLIELVEQFPVLYDMNLARYRDHNVRNNAWEHIAERMNTSVEEVKNKWGKLRNCYTNALKRRSRKSGQVTTNMVPWKFEKQMEFLLPHLERKSTSTNSGDINHDDSTQDFDLKSEEWAVSPPPANSTTTPRAPSSSTSTVRDSTPNDTGSSTSRSINKTDSDNTLLREMVSVMKSLQENKQKRTITEMDENDYFFLSMSEQLKNCEKRTKLTLNFNSISLYMIQK
ncbi:hypothetical protein HHI36_024238 [Cryptolaemus montrouzieri]|uniref:MADF domain-containing protein n=1 Tax=Cryptolaemus montrouzieri TaxID=559131 RepID=A0ABD2NJ50_9CUCU